jgi:hypothetical protein
LLLLSLTYLPSSSGVGTHGYPLCATHGKREKKKKKKRRREWSSTNVEEVRDIAYGGWSSMGHTSSS